MSELPSNWAIAKWKDITGVDGFRRGPFGGNLKKSCFVSKGFAVYEQYAPINNDCKQFRYFVSADKYNELSSFHVNSGDFLISCSGTMGRITCVPDDAPKGVINQALLRIRLQGDFINSDYFLKLFKSPVVQNLVLSKSVGGAIQNLAAVKELKEISLPLAPLNEQKRIVEKLDEVLAQVDTIKARLDGIPAILKRFRQSVLASAVSGKLTEEWRGSNNNSPVESLIEKCIVTDSRNNKNALKAFRADEIKFNIPDTWAWVRLSRITEVVSGVAKGSKTKSEVVSRPYLRVANVQRGYLDLNEVKEILVPVEKAENLKLLKGDILFNEGGDIDKLGRGWVWEEQIEKCIHQNHVFRARCYSSDIEPKFISHYGNSSGKEYFLREGTQSVNLANINKTTLSLLPIPLPPKEEQKEIVRLVDQYFAFADTIEAQVKKAQARVDNLTQSILAKAFRGELVPQDPNDEPADKLLERIAAVRKEAEALAKAVKKAQTAKKRTVKKESAQES